MVKHDEVDYWFVHVNEFWKGHPHQGKINLVKVHNLVEFYDLWQDLCKANVDISFGQFIQIAPFLGRTWKKVLQIMKN
jgi:hypothetical protein